MRANSSQRIARSFGRAVPGHDGRAIRRAYECAAAADWHSAPIMSRMSLDYFHPLVREWFAERFGAPTEAQAQSWPAIVAGEHTLVAAPTGSGKTLAAFLASIDRLLRQAIDDNAAGRNAGRLRLAAEGAEQRHPPQSAGAAGGNPRRWQRRRVSSRSRFAWPCAPATRRPASGRRCCASRRTFW